MLFRSIIEPVAFGKLLADIDSVTDFYGHAKSILKLQAMLFQRSGDMCSMRWDSIDFDAKTWTFSPQKTGNRGDMVASLVVPLPTQLSSCYGHYTSKQVIQIMCFITTGAKRSLSTSSSSISIYGA